MSSQSSWLSQQQRLSTAAELRRLMSDTRRREDQEDEAEVLALMAKSESENSMRISGTGLMDMYESRRYSDLDIICGEGENAITLHAHRMIICSRSKVFAAMIDGHFKEAMTSKIELKHDDPAIVDCIIQYLYTGDFMTPTERNYLGSLSDIYEMADKYNIAGLGDTAKAKFLETLIKINEGSNSSNTSSESQSEREEMLLGFLESVRTVYSQNTCTRWFREKLVKFFYRNGMLLKRHSSERIKVAFRDAFLESPEFGFDFANITIEKPSENQS